MKRPFFLGIDIGTQGARVALMDAAGDIIGSEEEKFPLNDKAREEQSPQGWWDACLASLKKMLAGSGGLIEPDSIRAVAVTSTSGTVIPLDVNYRPLHDAIMYSDKRSDKEAEKCKAAALKYHPNGYTNFNTSSGLSKMVWFVEHFPDKAKKVARWIHAADYITGRLSGIWDMTDYTNALKSGFDLVTFTWPAYIYEVLPLREEWLQQVVPSGSPIGMMKPELVRSLGLEGEIHVVAGITDGCASQIASGAIGVGEWNTTIGTTLVIKGVTREEIRDPLGRLYSHRHPDAGGNEETGWMPGGASNTGGDWIAGAFSDKLESLNQEALQLIPTGRLSWPLLQQGERFPFMAPQARGFEPFGLSLAEHYTANMEGVAYIERMAYDLVRNLSGEKITGVYTAGGGANSEPWLIIRSNVLNLPLYKMKHVAGAVGAAILAASKTHFGSVGDAVRALTQIDKIIRPDGDMARRYDSHYHRFVSILHEKGYLPD